jgi:adenylate cyclase class 2
MSQEVEIKFLVDNIRRLNAKLRAAGFHLVTRRTHEMNTLYDDQAQSLRARGELLRVRKYGERWILTHKAKGVPGEPGFGSLGWKGAGRHKVRVETETGVADGDKLAAIFYALGFAPSFRYEKFRSEWSDGKGHVVVDETPIGNVSEIEGPPRWIDATARRLGVSREQYITDTYAELFAKWKVRTGSAATEMTFKAVKLPSNKLLPPIQK